MTFPRRVSLPNGLPAGGGIQKSNLCLVTLVRNPLKANVWIPACAGMTCAQRVHGKRAPLPKKLRSFLSVKCNKKAQPAKPGRRDNSRDRMILVAGIVGFWEFLTAHG